MSGYFLDVQSSALGRPWRARLDSAGELSALAIAQIGGQDELLARVLAGRGVAPQAVERYLDPTLRDLMPDPFCLRDMEAATDRLKRAVERGERIAIFGDYDVDGACSAALLSEYLAACGCETIVHIPDRVTEGYGPNGEAIAGFAAKGATLLVTVDCGAVSHEPFELASRLGLDVIVFDHHQTSVCLPKTLALVDPNRQDDLSGLGYLSAAGVVFMALVALGRALREAGFWNGRRAPDLIAALDLVALATVADVVPLDGFEPRLCRQGARRHAPAATSGACGPVRRRGRRRTASALSPGLSHRSAHQRGRTHRRRGLGRPAPDHGRRPRGARHRLRTRPAEPRAARDRDRGARGGRSRGAARARPRGAWRGGRRRCGRNVAAGGRRPHRGAAQGTVRAPGLRA